MTSDWQQSVRRNIPVVFSGWHFDEKKSVIGNNPFYCRANGLRDVGGIVMHVSKPGIPAL
jgi:hypothetical protein